MKKKILLVLSLIAILTVLFAISVSAATPVETWDISSTSSDSVTASLYNDTQNAGYYTLTISGTGYMKSWSDESYAPWYSSYDSKIKSVTIENGVTSIGGYAFYNCSSLTSVVIPDSVTSIGDGAFRSCKSLTSAVIPDSVTSIGDSAFSWCHSLKSVVIGNSVTSIGGYAFYNCYSLTSVVIPDSVTSIGNYAFGVCTSLTSITVDENNKAYKSINGNLYTKDGKTLVRYAIGKKDTKFVIPNSVISIGDSAFWYCYSLTSVVIPNSVTSIGDSAFAGCDSLTSVVIPDRVTSIGDYAFQSCTSLTSVVIPDSVTSIGNYAFYNCEFLTSVVISDSVTSIGDSAFRSCTSLTIYCEAQSKPSGWDSNWNPSNCPVVWGHAHVDHNRICFCGMRIPCIEKWDISANGDGSVMAYLYNDEENAGYYTLTIGGTGNTKDWSSSFSAPWYSLYGTKIKSVTIENGVTSIGSWAFSGCSSLKNIVIHDSVTSIGEKAFYYCTSLTIYCEAQSEPSGWDSNWNVLEELEEVLIVPVVWGHKHTYENGKCACGMEMICVEKWDVSSNQDGSVMAYLYIDVENAGYYTLMINGTGNMKNWTSSTSTEAPWYLLCKGKIKSITIENGVTSIGDYAFEYCVSLTSVVIPNSVTSIGNRAFSYCTSLTSVVIGNGVTSIGNYAFSYCTSLTRVVIGDGVTSIGYSAFEYCVSLTRVVIGDGVTSIGNRAFYNCTSLTSVVIPDSVTSIGNGAFSYCTSLTSVVIGNGVTSIGVYAFYNCYSITSVVIGNGVTSIGHSAFRDCYSITSVVIPDSVTSISDYAFYNCESLTSVVIPDSVTSIGYYAFRDCDSLTIYCEAESKPSGWDSYWNYSDCPVVWGHSHIYVNGECECGMYNKDVLLEEIFTFKGYSFGFAGQITFGYDIDYEALALYEEKTGEKLEIGVLFVGYNNLGGKQPIDTKGQAGAYVVKQELGVSNFKHYNFIIKNLKDSQKDVKLVVSAYIYDGEAVKYIQENGLSDTVSSITYNEAKLK